MVRLVALLLCLGATGCTAPEYNKPIEMTSHGAAVRANMAAHIINPVPAPPRALVSDASRPVQATQQYRTNEVEAAAPDDGRTLTGAGE